MHRERRRSGSSEQIQRIIPRGRKPIADGQNLGRKFIHPKHVFHHSNY